MPRKRATRSSNDSLGPAAIGAALKLHWRDIDWQDINIAFDRLTVACESTYTPILLVDEARVISHGEKLRRVFEWDNWLGESGSSIGVLVMILRKEGASEFMGELWRQNGVGDEEIEKELASRPALPDCARGLDLKTAVEQCITVLRKPMTNAASQNIAALGSLCLDAIVKELRRLGILGICDYCGLTLFPTTPRRQVCSFDYEGRNGSGRRRAKRAYERAQGRTR